MNLRETLKFLHRWHAHVQFYKDAVSVSFEGLTFTCVTLQKAALELRDYVEVEGLEPPGDTIESDK